MIQRKYLVTLAAALLLVAGLHLSSAQAGPVEAKHPPAGSQTSADGSRGQVAADDNSALEDENQQSNGKARGGRGRTVLFILTIALVNFSLGFGARHALPHLLRAFGESRPDSPTL